MPNDAAPPVDDEPEFEEPKPTTKAPKRVTFTKDDVQAFFDMKIVTGVEQEEAIKQTEEKFELKNLEVSPTGDVRLPDEIPDKEYPSAAPPPAGGGDEEDPEDEEEEPEDEEPEEEPAPTAKGKKTDKPPADDDEEEPKEGFNPSDPQLWERTRARAGNIFEGESVMATAWTIQEYKRHGGTF